jgi:hypothetical protein
VDRYRATATLLAPILLLLLVLPAVLVLLLLLPTELPLLLHLRCPVQLRGES